MNKSYATALPEEWQKISAIFAALGDSHRQQIVLMFERDERLNVGQIVATSKLARSTISHHLAVLHRAGILSSEKVKKEVYFWVNRDVIETALTDVLTYLRTTY